VIMFLIPAGMLFGAPVSIGKWILWNQIPVTVGNIVAGALFTGAALHISYYAKPAAMEAGTVVELPEARAVHTTAFAHAAGSESR